MKKCVAAILIIVSLINLITVKSFADEIGTQEPTEATTTAESEESPSLKILNDSENYWDRLDEARTEVVDMYGKGKLVETTGTTHTGSAVFAILSHLFGVIPQVVNQVLELSLETIGGEKMVHFTIYDTVVGNYDLFNITYNDVPTTLKANSPAHTIFKYRVIYFYKIIRNLSIALILFVLIYIGIRMAISTIADDRAKYKKMLVNWVASLLLVFLMHYIIIIISAFQGTILKYIRDIASGMMITDTLPVSQIETQIFSDAKELYGETSIWNVAMSVFTMWVLVYYQLKFFLMYVKRLLEVGFLIIIAPLVTITYSIDKIGDNRAQAFKVWLSELIMKATIQIVHAVLYMVFIASAGFIATKHPLLAALFFAFLSRGEKIVRNIFNVKDNGFERVKIPFIHRH